MDSPETGDEIVVTNGSYATVGRAVDKPLMLRSVYGPQFPVIEGRPVPSTTDREGAVRCVYLTSGVQWQEFGFSTPRKDGSVSNPADARFPGVFPTLRLDGCAALVAASPAVAAGTVARDAGNGPPDRTDRVALRVPAARALGPDHVLDVDDARRGRPRPRLDGTFVRVRPAGSRSGRDDPRRAREPQRGVVRRRVRAH